MCRCNWKCYCHSITYVHKFNTVHVHIILVHTYLSSGFTGWLDDFVKDLTQLVKVTSPSTEKKRKGKEFKPLPPPPIITSFEANKFYESVLSATEFTKLLEERLKSTALEEVCWK